MQLIAQILEQMPANVAGWLAVVAGLAAFAALLAWLEPAPKNEQAVQAPLPAQTFEAAAEFQRVMDVSLVELTTRPDLRSLHMQASMLVDATDHAVNRLRNDLSRVTGLISPPAFEPLRQLLREPVALPRPALQQPLAA